jgi:integrase
MSGATFYPEGLVLAMLRANLPFEGLRTLSINRTVQHQTGKGVVEVEPKTASSRRTVDLLELTVDALRVHHEHQAFEKRQLGEHYVDQDFVFARATGGPQGDSGIARHWTSALEGAGLPYIRRHDLRHTAATLRLEGGSSLLEVMHDLGHTNLRTTGIYSHHTPAMRRASADKMEALLRGVEARSS